MNNNKKFIEETISETKQLVRDLSFRAYSERGEEILIVELFGNSYNNTEQYRLCKWLAFFNEHYTQCICIHPLLIRAVIDFMDNNEFFRTQTSYEMELSQAFLRELFQANFLLDIRDLDIRDGDSLEVIQELMIVALIYGKYSGMVIRSPKQAVQLLSQGISDKKIIEMFEYLFVKYEMPKLLTSNFCYFTAEEIDILMFVLQGNSIRKYPKLPLPISKQESFILMNSIPLDLVGRLLTYIILSKLMLKTKSKHIDLLHHIALNYRYLREDSSLIDNINFWADAVNLIYALNSPLAELYWRSRIINDLLDYLVYMRYESGNANFSLKGRTIHSLLRAMEESHENAQYESIIKWKELSWQGNKINEYKIAFNGENFLFKELTNGDELYEESEKMKHCVFTYAQKRAYNQSRIWSMQKETNGSYAKCFTIELWDNQIVQVRGKHNAAPSEEDLQVIEKWNNERFLGK